MASTLDHKEKLNNIILRILSGGENSISGVLKELTNSNRKIHRLTLTGYLMALADVGILKEREIKPSKIYSVNNVLKRDIYAIIGESVRELSDDREADYALMVMNDLFNRPIFLKELERCGVGIPRDYRKVIPPERKEYIKQLASFGISIPESNIMMEPLRVEDNIVKKILRLSLLNGLDIRQLQSLPRGKTQKTLLD